MLISYYYCIAALWLVLFQPHLIDFMPAGPYLLQKLMFGGALMLGWTAIAANAFETRNC